MSKRSKSVREIRNFVSPAAHYLIADCLDHSQQENSDCCKVNILVQKG
jgi:hypothetical protein